MNRGTIGVNSFPKTCRVRGVAGRGSMGLDPPARTRTTREIDENPGRFSEGRGGVGLGIGSSSPNIIMEFGFWNDTFLELS